MTRLKVKIVYNMDVTIVDIYKDNVIECLRMMKPIRLTATDYFRFRAHFHNKIINLEIHRVIQMTNLNVVWLPIHK